MAVRFRQGWLVHYGTRRFGLLHGSEVPSGLAGSLRDKAFGLLHGSEVPSRLAGGGKNQQQGQKTTTKKKQTNKQTKFKFSFVFVTTLRLSLETFWFCILRHEVVSLVEVLFPAV